MNFEREAWYSKKRDVIKVLLSFARKRLSQKVLSYILVRNMNKLDCVSGEQKPGRSDLTQLYIMCGKNTSGP